MEDELLSITETFGNPLFKILIVLIVLDIISGLIRATINKELDSSIGLEGLLKHMLVIITIGIVIMFTPALGLGILGDTFVVFYIIQYAISMVESFERLGLPVPKGLKKFLKDKQEEENYGKYNKHKK